MLRKLDSKQLSELVAVLAQVQDEIENATEGVYVHGLSVGLDYLITLTYEDDSGEYKTMTYAEYLEQMYLPEEVESSKEQAEKLDLDKSEYQY